MDTFDVLIIGAGLSGIGAAWRLQQHCPDQRYAVLEARAELGGTWDLFRYPGIRSDSDMFTLSYPFRPWQGGASIADGASIAQYLRDTARAGGIERHIRFNQRVLAAAWDSAQALWTLQVDIEGVPCQYQCRFLYLCCGYYDYAQGYRPAFPDQACFAGRWVHPQQWPQDLDWRDRRVVVIGSGATAVTLVPALAETARQVTLLQRSPSYVLALPARDPLANALRRCLPPELAGSLARWKNALAGLALFQVCRRLPGLSRKLLRQRVAAALPAGYAVDTHFNPRYAPWDQRLCIVPDGDLFRAIASGKAQVVTDTIASIETDGLRLTSGGHLAADIIVTATGLTLQACGGMALSVDGQAVDLGQRVAYEGLLLEGVPNLAFCVGYTNASWTLRADLSSRQVCRLLNHMRRHGHRQCRPRLDGPAGARRPLLDLHAGYVLRALDGLPKQGARAPWLLRQNYVLDYLRFRLGRVKHPALEFF
ncbi:flavin-containing monooxygenase [Pseudomonas eucalypticola]|uniref:NAD(P)/FAD-dependent oxidoreductase n=1 Tax=Pseudomonas eucalypticola TaxID=2599595 RepID=A0A7D5HG00_9PSED|nr:NAD(P)/FAD-dependent oxidoreductase [Pseudomonas eucalypticola]QKZ04346.1 NAD(P)/FAD-dependent oxidoreductase [Pseudomonas eucalypticola]